MKVRRFKLIPFDNVRVSKAPSYTIKGLMPETGVGVIWGPKACGKSFLTFDMVMHVALGRKYRGHKVEQGVVVYCAFEGGTGFKLRMEAFRQANMKNWNGKKVPFYLQPLRMSLIGDSKQLIRDITEQITDPPRIVVLDTLNRSLEGNENGEDMSSYFAAADEIREAFDCVVLIIHHCGVEGTRPRGHTSLTHNAEFQFKVFKDSAGYSVMEVEYMKDGSGEGTQIGAQIVQWELGKDEEGDPITSCIVKHSIGYTAASRKTGRPNKAQDIALEALKKVSKDGAASEDAWRKQAYDDGITDSDNPKSRQMAFNRSRDALIEVEDVIEKDGKYMVGRR